jgi:hypothetical protein
MSASHAELIRKTFRDFVCHHCGTESTSDILETTLIRGGSYCGRRFSLSGFSMIWFIDEQQVKLFGQDGALIRGMSTREFCEGVARTVDSPEIRRAA